MHTIFFMRLCLLYKFQNFKFLAKKLQMHTTKEIWSTYQSMKCNLRWILKWDLINILLLICHNPPWGKYDISIFSLTGIDQNDIPVQFSNFSGEENDFSPPWAKRSNVLPYVLFCKLSFSYAELSKPWILGWKIKEYDLNVLPYRHKRQNKGS